MHSQAHSLVILVSFTRQSQILCLFCISSLQNTKIGSISQLCMNFPLDFYLSFSCKTLLKFFYKIVICFHKLDGDIKLIKNCIQSVCN